MAKRKKRSKAQPKKRAKPGRRRAAVRVKARTVSKSARGKATKPAVARAKPKRVATKKTMRKKEQQMKPPGPLGSPSPLHNERIVNWLKFFTQASLDGDGHLEFQTTGATKGLLSASAPDKQKDSRDESRNAMIRMSPQPDTGEVLACSRL